jgi:hypothetical protein
MASLPIPPRTGPCHLPGSDDQNGCARHARQKKRREQELIDNIRSLPADKLEEVENFVDFLREREDERRLAQAVTGASAAALAKVWDNPDDAAYDRL